MSPKSPKSISPAVATTAVDSEPTPPAFPPAKIHPLVNEQAARDIWSVLFALRFVNALVARTFFQPDEYFQSLEPAWRMVFGADSGAWITWEWNHQLRSSLHPALFAFFYAAADALMVLLSFFPQFRAMALGVLPNLVQGVIAAFGDFYTWKLAQKMYGAGSDAGSAALLMTIFSPWNWFCSTRTFSNCLETTLTITALALWPWELTLNPKAPATSTAGTAKTVPAKTPEQPSIFADPQIVKNLRISLFLASTACILRPTNALIWLCIGVPTLQSLFSPSSRLTPSDKRTFLSSAVNSVLLVVLLSLASDRFYYGVWTFPPYQFLKFNLSLDLAVFYGRNAWHYYLTQGLPLLLTTYTPFALVGLWTAVRRGGLEGLIAATVGVTVVALSLVSHKEVRFIYPLLPMLHIIAAPSIASFFYSKTTPSPPAPATKPITQQKPPPAPSTAIRRRPLLILLLLLNVSLSLYTTLSHQRALISCVTYIRTQYEDLALDARGVPLSSPLSNTFPDSYEFPISNFPKTTDYSDDETFVGFLMPCHSTPWRSRLFHKGLRAWALECEPPVGLEVGSVARNEYRDEADRFYDDPAGFLEREVGTRERPWPRYLVGFEGIEGVLREWYEGKMKGFQIREKWRGGNSMWHDDWRRKGDVIVWEFVEGDGKAK